ncbi:glycosyltransferase [Methylocella sp.]|uniref:CgeB family protein n=1 Tax=Methylocella sp. TaxID=1978226 RepID=UPI00378315EB
MKVLYIGPESGTAIHRINAFRRLGHEVRSLDAWIPVDTLPVIPERLTDAWVVRTGAFGLGRLVENWMFRQIGGETFDVVFVDHGELVDASCVRRFKTVSRVVVNYNQDNPYVSRDMRKWRLFLKALPYYDLVATPRSSSVEPARRAGAKHVMLVRQAADEAIHRPIELSDEDRARFSSDVAFVGTWMPERGPFMLRLIERGVPIVIYGPRWNKAPEYERLRANVRLGTLEGLDYVKAIRGAKIAIGLLSKGNEDLYTTRSLEIPATGTAFCAERTPDHLDMYVDGEEAVFFDDADECADRCLELLKTPEKIAAIAAAGHRKVVRNGDFNEILLTRIVDHALKAEAFA